MSSDRDILEARAKRLATPLAKTAVLHGVAALEVEIDGQRFAFPLIDVRRALVLGPLTELPHMPPIVLGLGTADGDVLAVFDGRVWAGGARRPGADRTPVLILGTAQAPLALAVDRFAGSLVLPTTEQQITDDGVLIVAVAALLQDPRFSLAMSSERTADDHH